MEEILFVIPARGGSKRLPGKNLLPLGGKPLIAWTIEAALASGLPGLVCVSTDDEEISAAAVRHGALAPFTRPSSLATDEAGSAEVVAHALEYFAKREGRTFSIVALLQPTSPFRDAGDILGSVALFRERRADNVVSVCPAEHSPLWMNTLPPDGSLRGFIREEARGKRSQDLPQYYRLNGAIYLCSMESFRAERRLLQDENAWAYIMSVEHSVDIDDETDFRAAEAMLAVREGKRRA